jgi:8-oxo-dGTP pyrophosphatase MutT (NUDIX family)
MGLVTTFVRGNNWLQSHGDLDEPTWLALRAMAAGLQDALRELFEETGIPGDAVTSMSGKPIDIDVHPIPANYARGEPGHQHFDFRFLLRTDADVGQLQTEEVTDAAWYEISAVEDARLRHRLLRALPGSAD